MTPNEPRSRHVRRSSDRGGHPVIQPASIGAQTSAQPPAIAAQKKYQAKPPATQPFDAKAFAPSDRTTVRWTGNAGFFVNSRGTTLMIDPLLQGFDMPIMIEMPILPKDVPRLDAVLVTHSDNDHYSVPTLRIWRTSPRRSIRPATWPRS